MTVSISERLSPLYEGNGINTRFDFTFRVFDQEDANGVSVKHQVGADFENIDESLYSVTINPDNLGGYITFLTAPEVGFEFYIAGETPVDQQLDITNYDNFYPDAIERSLDKLTAILQEWAHSLGFERLSRTKALELLDLALQDQIRNQGLALDQIDAFAKDLANRLETIVVERGWLAELVADGDENQKQINLRLKTIFVFPEHFNDDIIAAAAFASANNATLVTKNKTYEMSQEFVLPENLTWLSCYTTIKQVAPATEDRRAAGIAPQSNVTIQGHLTIDMGTPTTGWGEKCHVRIDSFYNVTPKVRGFNFDTIKLKGGHFNCNGVVMAGGASLVRGKRIEMDDSAVMGRPFMAHWGNFDQHYNDNGTYRHVENWQPTTHPHDCIIDEIAVGNLTCNTDDFSGIALVSAGYDIEIKKITGNLLDSTISGKALFMATAGDLGFAYASQDEKSIRMRGLKVGTVVGTTYAIGVGQIGRALYASQDDYTNVAVPPSSNDYFACIQLDVVKIDVVGKKEVGVVSNIALNGSNGRGRTKVDTIISIDCYNSVYLRNNNRNTTIDKIISNANKTNSVIIEGSSNLIDELPTNTVIKEIYASGFGLTSVSNQYRTVVNNSKSVNTQFEKIVVEEAASNAQAYAVVSTTNGIGRGLKISSIVINDAANWKSSILVNNGNDVGDPVQLDHWIDQSGKVTTSVSGGVTVRNLGRTKEFTATFIPAINMQIGDTLIVVNGASISKYSCYVAGVIGGSAKIKLIDGGETSFAQAEISIPANTSVLLTSGRNMDFTPLSSSLVASYSVNKLSIILMPVMTADNTFSVYGFNPTSSAITLPAGTMTVRIS
ncbi:phage tail protein [Acinetobacter baumannii]